MSREKLIGTLVAARVQAISLAAGSCSCGVKSPDAAMHTPECRYSTASYLLENLEEVIAALKARGGA